MLIERTTSDAHELVSSAYSAFQVVTSLPFYNCLQRDPLATHSNILAWKIPWMKEPVQSMGSQRVGHD